MNQLIRLSALFLLFLPLTGISQQTPSLNEQLRSKVKSEPFNVAMLFQSQFRYSFNDDSFLGGRTFQVPQGRVDITGNLDKGYFYRLHVNMVTEPNILDAYVGYKHNDKLIFTLGRQKPQQSPDFIPGPQGTDFMARARITGFLVQSREIGLSVQGTSGDIYYFAGIFNGVPTSSNLGNDFYGIGRLQYTVNNLGDGFLRLGVHGSYGSGSAERPAPFGGTYLVSDRAIFGLDAHYQAKRWKLKGEYMRGKLDNTLLMPGFLIRDELITGYYISGAYNVSDELTFVGRFQQWKRDDPRDVNYQSTVGLKYQATSIVSFRVNLDVYTPVGGDTQVGVGAMMQVYF